MASTMQYTNLINTTNAPALSAYEPYDRIADENGNPLAFNSYRQSFIDESQRQGLLNWNYIPLNETDKSNNQLVKNSFRLNNTISFLITKGLKAEALYQLIKNNSRRKRIYGEDSYYVRNLINNYTQRLADGSLSRAIPSGAIFDTDLSEAINHNIRGQLKYDRAIGSKHQLNGLAGYELKTFDTEAYEYRLYGYDTEHATSMIVDYVSVFPTYSRPGSRVGIPSRESQSGLTDHFISWYGNLSYQYANRWVLFGSGRIDRSNLFGVNTNQKSNPAYAVGINWSIDKEPFYKLKWLEQLNLRSSFGYTGNIDKTLSAYTTASYLAASRNPLNTRAKLPYAQIVNPPDPELRWEKIKIINIGLDFAMLKRAVSGSIDVYTKKGIDLIGDTPFPASSGILNFRGNYANTKVKGFDLTLNTLNINKQLQWRTSFFLSYAHEEVTNYARKGTTQNYLYDRGTPMMGKPLYAMYSLPWAGLDPQTGDPLGYLNGEKSNNYAEIFSKYTPEDLLFNGLIRPSHYGAIRNDFNWRGFSLSVNMNYRLGYVFKKPSISYQNTYGLTSAHADYYLRWQKPGDEQITNVPSIPATANNLRDNFYGSSTILLSKGDHVRLQDIRLAYTMKNIKPTNSAFKNVEIYLYSNNIGLLYNANKVVDPDYYASGKPPLSFSLGIRTGF